ncbi:hypothetical protein, conserved [Leishmania tarentolae]|uniref:MINDY4 N-terminal dimerisation domain-containing protein n=1 Tax=Leishmania tarentolae TaxID=5689 RepID=A0A640KC89_LEITA|nr:hypothetical protein, conserved [Leishmania tarentolae]
MTQPPRASEKEKTARLVESLSRHEQVELLAQALLREYMHRRGLRVTLHAFDEESPRDERTISSRALMRQLLNIPVEGRPSRLQPTASSSAKQQAPTFMEELCSYRLTKRSYRSLDGKRGGEQQCSQEEDPSDVELRALHEAADAQRAAKALCEQKQREYEALLAAEEAYQKRKEEHKESRKHTHKKRHRVKKLSPGDACSSDDGAESESDYSDNNDDDGAVFDVGHTHASRKAKSASSGKRRLSAESRNDVNTAAVVVGARWQPPGNTIHADANHGTCADGVSRRSGKLISVGAAPLGLGSADKKEGSDRESEDDPFGLSGASQRALMARVRAESERWSTQVNKGATHAHASSKNNGDGDGGAPDSTWSTAPAALSTLTMRGAGDRGLATMGSARPVSLAAAGFNPNCTYTSPSFSGPLSATAPAGSNGGMAALRMKASAIPIPGLSADGSATGPSSPHSSRFASATPAVNSAPSILVKHVSSRQQRDDDLASEGPLHSYDRTAVPRSSALAAARGSSPNPSLSEAASSAFFHMASRSPVSNAGSTGGSGGGGGGGLRHGIGFRTCTSAEGTASSFASLANTEDPAAGATKPSRKERRVKLLVD